MKITRLSHPKVWEWNGELRESPILELEIDDDAFHKYLSTSKKLFPYFANSQVDRESIACHISITHVGFHERPVPPEKTPSVLKVEHIPVPKSKTQIYLNIAAVILLLIIALTLLAPKGHSAPEPTDFNVASKTYRFPQGVVFPPLQFQNAGVVLGNPFIVNCSTNTTCSISGSVLTLTATGGSSTPCVVTAFSVQYNNGGAFGCLGVGTATTVLHGSAAGVAAFSSVVSADLNITPTTCTNQFLNAISAAAGGTCAAVNLANAVTGQLPISAVGSAGLSATFPITIASTGVIACPTCFTTVTRGLVADCQILETVGTTIDCGAAGNGTFGSTTAAPAFVSQTGLGTVLAMDNFTNATIITAGNWTVEQGAITATSGTATGTTISGANSIALGTYTGLALSTISQSQWAQVTLVGAPTGGGKGGPTVRGSQAAETFYACTQSTTTLAIQRDIAGTLTTLTSTARTPGAGDIVYLSISQGASQTAAVLSCTGTTSLGVAVNISISDTPPATVWTGQTGVAFILTNANGSPALKNFLTGTLSTSPNSGGLVFGGGQYVLLPASLNTALTIEIYACYQNGSNTNPVNALVMGNGNGAASNANGLILNQQATAVTLAGLNHLQTVGGSALTTIQLSTLNGCGLASQVYGNSTATNNLDRIFVNGTESSSYGVGAQGAAAGLQTVGAYQLGGTPAGSGSVTQFYYTGTIYRARFFSVQLNPSEIAQDSVAIAQSMAGRGVVTLSGSNSANDTVVAVGDSMTTGQGTGTPTTQAWTQVVTLNNPTNSSSYANSGLPWNMAIGGGSSGSALGNFITSSIIAAPDQVADPLYTPSGNRNAVALWIGTNDLVQLGSTGIGSSNLLDQTANYSKARKAVGWKVIVASVVSRGTGASCIYDTNKDTYNPLLRQAWSTFADGFVDLASHIAFADGTCTGTAFQSDNIHPTQYGHSLIAYMMQREVNTVFGNHDFTSGNSYTATATVAVATTAGTSAGNIATITMAATQPWAKGQCVVLAGITPATYNTIAGHCNLVLTSSSTQITVTTSGATLGPITVQGTVVAAQELDQDQYATLAGSGAGLIHTLQTAQGRVGHNIYRRNTNTNTWTITPFGSETINGAATYTLAPNQVICLQSSLVSNTAGAANWIGCGTSGLVNSVTAPVTLSAAGVLACATCVTSSGGGAETATAPITVSAAGLIACATCALTTGTNYPTGIHNFNQAAQSTVTVANTPVYMTSSNLPMPAAYTTPIGAGTTMRWHGAMTKTAAGTGAFNIIIYKGTNGSTADTAVVTQSIGTQTAALDDMTFDVTLTWTSTTAAFWSLVARQTAATGTGFGIVFPATATYFSGTISGQTTTTASDKYGLGFTSVIGTPTIVIPMVQGEAIGVN